MCLVSFNNFDDDQKHRNHFSTSQKMGNRKNSNNNKMTTFFVDTILPWEAVKSRRIIATAARRRRRDKLHLIVSVLSFRFLYLLTMSISCHFIPEHNPGDDVLRFDMRLLSVGGGNEAVVGTNNNDHYDGCFCLSGDVCDDTDRRRARHTNDHEEDNIEDGCAIYWNDLINSKDNNNTISAFTTTTTRSTRRNMRMMWNFILSPVTKWDAARFLTLAVRPNVRDPVVPIVSSSSAQADPSLLLSFATSEQAHPFLPMFPYVIRTLAVWYVSWMPTVLRPYLIPPTFEGLVTFMGYLFNNIVCSIIIILCMFELTTLLCTANGNDADHGDGENTKKENDQNHRSNQSDSSTTTTTTTSSSSSSDRPNIAWTTCIVVGIWNPATVFFSSNYSESFFCATTLFGHVCMQKMKQHELQRQRHPGSKIFWWILAIWSWMIGSYTRSNGTIHCLWLIQDAIAELIFLYDTNRRQKQSRTSPIITNIIPSMVMILGRCIIGAALVAFPVRCHDWTGYHRHCSNYILKYSNGLEPDWCHYGDGEVDLNINNNIGAMVFGKHGIFRMPFSLYGYVQDKHWNVGMFRYYTFNQIPNFLFATPVMILCFAGVSSWIYWSLVVDYGKGKLPKSMYMILVGWPLYALPKSVSFSSSVDSANNTKDQPKDGSLSSEVSSSCLVNNRWLLGHYAILAVLGLIGLLIAHIQISTRMIFSSSPAIWWFLTYCMLLPSSSSSSSSSSSKDDSDPNKTKSSLLRSRIPATNIWCCGYCILFMILGMILHVNFLPWT